MSVLDTTLSYVYFVVRLILVLQSSMREKKNYEFAYSLISFFSVFTT